MPKSIYIKSSHIVSPLGIGTPQTWAAVRAGLSQWQTSSAFGPDLEPITLSMLPEDALDPLPDETENWGLTSTEARLLQLALPALSGALEDVPSETKVALFLGVPSSEDLGDQWLSRLAYLAGPRIDAAKSAIFADGRASVFAALAKAEEHLQSSEHSLALVGGVDTHFGARRLSSLFASRRLLSTNPQDGFTPAEGAACLLLSTQPPTDERESSRLCGSGMARGVSHVDAETPHLGEELAKAIADMRSKPFKASAPAEVIFCGFNGEQIWAKEWGVARLRNGDIIAGDSMIEHPADRLGDMGAALGACLLAVADLALTKGHRDAPALIWASSDEGLRGAAWLELSHL